MRAIDLFAGAGGFSEGARAAGLQVVWAANHWQTACDVHEANHGFKPSCQDLHQADWTQVPAHDVLLASPCCHGHSKARGKDRPHHDASRSTAWAVVSAAECHRPQALVVENVPDFQNWALFPAWLASLQTLGYTVRAGILDAQHFGVPQERKRLFMVGTLEGPGFDFRGLGGLPMVPISEALDLGSGVWSSWRPEARKKPLCANTMERIQAGVRRYGRSPFWVPYFGGNRHGWPLDQPIWTITTRDRYALVHGDRFRLLTVDECRKAMGFPAGYRLTGKIHTDKILLGNAVCPPVATTLLQRLQAAL